MEKSGDNRALRTDPKEVEMEFTLIVAVLMVAYLLGSIPVAVIIARHVAGSISDASGTGTMGARNTFRSLGPRFGVMVAVLDIAKGALAVAIAHLPV